jgi:hypothetical protein
LSRVTDAASSYDYSPRQWQDSERKPISGAQRRRLQPGMPSGAIRNTY